MFSGIFLAKINYTVDLRLIGGAVDVKIIQVAEPPVTKTLTFIDAIIMKAHTDKLVWSSPYTCGGVFRGMGPCRPHVPQVPRAPAADRDVRIMRLILSRGRSRTIPQAVHEKRDARRKLK